MRWIEAAAEQPDSISTRQRYLSGDLLLLYNRLKEITFGKTRTKCKQELNVLFPETYDNFRCRKRFIASFRRLVA